jgi:hypothetical protein
VDTKDITRLVVGEPFVLTLGATSADTLTAHRQVEGGEWRGGRQHLKPTRKLGGLFTSKKTPTSVLTVTAQASGINPRTSRSASTSVSTIEPPHSAPEPEQTTEYAKEPVTSQIATTQRGVGLKVAAICGGLALVAIAATAYVWFMPERSRVKPPNNDDIAVVPDAGSSKLAVKEATVRTVDEPWIREAPARDPDQMNDANNTPAIPTIPVLPPDASLATSSQTTANTNNATPSASSSSKKPNDKPADTKGEAKGDAKQDKKSVAAAEAVVLDMEPASSASKAKDSHSSSTAAEAPPTKEPSKRTPGAGLVAITPDGKAALFTNPATRLPEKFVVGEKNRAGEVIQSIDAKNGVVKTENKEYRLE